MRNKNIQPIVGTVLSIFMVILFIYAYTVKTVELPVTIIVSVLFTLIAAFFIWIIITNVKERKLYEKWREDEMREYDDPNDTNLPW